MTSMWTALSDRDYFGDFAYGDYEQEEEYHCSDCGAGELEACEEWCARNAAAEEPPPTDCVQDDALYLGAKQPSCCDNSTAAA